MRTLSEKESDMQEAIIRHGMVMEGMLEHLYAVVIQGHDTEWAKSYFESGVFDNYPAWRKLGIAILDLVENN